MLGMRNRRDLVATVRFGLLGTDNGAVLSRERILFVLRRTSKSSATQGTILRGVQVIRRISPREVGQLSGGQVRHSNAASPVACRWDAGRTSKPDIP